MPRETTRIPTKGHDAIVGAMAYLAVCAFPESKTERDKFIDAAKRWLKWQYLPHGNAGDTIPRAIDQTLNKALKRLTGRRATAARGASFILVSATGKKQVGLRNLINRLRIIRDKSGRFVGRKDSKYFKQEVWKESLPVLHLLLAFDGVEITDVHDLIMRPDWLPDALARAEKWREAMTWTGRYARYECPLQYPFPIPEESTIQLIAE